MSLGHAAEQASRSTGLPKATCMTLLEAGWTLVTDIKEPTRWVSPELQRRAVVLEPGAITIVNQRDPRELAQEISAAIAGDCAGVGVGHE